MDVLMSCILSILLGCVMLVFCHICYVGVTWRCFPIEECCPIMFWPSKWLNIVHVLDFNIVTGHNPGSLPFLLLNMVCRA